MTSQWVFIFLGYSIAKYCVVIIIFHQHFLLFWRLFNTPEATNTSSLAQKGCLLVLSQLMNQAIFPRLPICHESATNAPTLSALLRRGISIHAKELRAAKAIIDGNLVRGILTSPLLEIYFLFALYSYIKNNIHVDTINVVILNHDMFCVNINYQIYFTNFLIKILSCKIYMCSVDG